jgi:hypothetical protein
MASIVEHFYVIEDIGTSLIPGSVDLFSYPFLFWATEKRFGNCIIPTVTSPTHAWFEVMRDTETVPGVTTVL